MRETVIEIINTKFILTSEAKTILTNGLLSFILNVFEPPELQATPKSVIEMF